KGRDILANLVQKSPVRINRSELAHAHNTLATYFESLYGIDDKAEASRIAAITEQAYLAAVALWKQLANEEPDVPARLQDLAGGYSNLARLNEHLGAIGKFKDSLDKSLEIRQQLVERYPQSQDYRDNLAASFNNFGIYYRGRNKFDQAE